VEKKSEIDFLSFFDIVERMKKIQYMKNLRIEIFRPKEVLNRHDELGYDSFSEDIDDKTTHYTEFPFSITIGSKKYHLTKVFSGNFTDEFVYNSVKKNPVLLFMD
jgi:hypothetical protein